MTVTGASCRKRVGGGQDPLALERRAGRWRASRRDREQRGEDGADHAQAHSNRSGRTCPLGPWTKWWNAPRVVRGLGVDEPRLGARGARLQHEAGRRVDEAGGADGEEHEAARRGRSSHERRDPVQVHRVEHLAEPDDGRAQQAVAAARPRTRSHGGGVAEVLATRRGTARARSAEQRVSKRLPCISTSRTLPARRCSPSTFCVTRRKRSPMRRLGRGERVRGRGSGARRCALRRLSE